MKKSKYIICFSLCLCCFLLTVFAERASSACKDALNMCLITVVPSLFPYMVVSSMLVTTGTADRISQKIPLARLYNLPNEASTAIILGFLCGFPLGAKCAVDLYKRGTLSKTQAEVLISVANNTGPSFVVSVIGRSFWKSTAFGWWLYLIQIFSSFTAGLIINRLVFPINNHFHIKTGKLQSMSISGSFYTAVCDSTGAVINVCGFIMIFSVIITYVSSFLDLISPHLSAIFAAFLEICEGTKLSALEALANNAVFGCVICGLSLGFSGLSVFCQTGAFTSPRGLRLKRLFAVKLFQGIICALLCLPLSMYLSFGAAEPVVYLVPDPIQSLLTTAVFMLFSLKILRDAHKM